MFSFRRIIIESNTATKIHLNSQNQLFTLSVRHTSTEHTTAPATNQ